MEKPVVLIVENESFIRMEAVRMIEDAGYTVLDASNTSDAMMILETRRDIHAIFTEVFVPGPLNGMELGQLVAKCWPQIGLIMTSSIPKPRTFPAAWRYVRKVYDGAQIAAALRALLAPRLPAERWDSGDRPIFRLS